LFFCGRIKQLGKWSVRKAENEILFVEASQCDTVSLRKWKRKTSSSRGKLRGGRIKPCIFVKTDTKNPQDMMRK
jgi:hypothetical protein